MHCIVTGGGLTPDGGWKATPEGYLFPVRWMSGFFRGAVLRDLTALWKEGTLDLGEEYRRPAAFAAWKKALYEESWVTYVKRPFAGPEEVFRYLGRYTHRVGISDARLLDVNVDGVTFARRGDAPLTLPGDEFLRRLLLHVLPPKFRKIRHYGLYAPAAVNTSLERARIAVVAAGLAQPMPEAKVAQEPHADPDDAHRTCPMCGVGVLRTILIAPAPRPRPLPQPAPPDTS